MELTPDKWFRFGNLIVTDNISIYCMELYGFPETHMLTKFKCDSFGDFPATIRNMGYRYEKVVSFSKKSGTVSRVVTENYVILLDEDKRVDAPNPEDFIDTTHECELPDQIPRPVVRNEYSDVYSYLHSKQKKYGQEWDISPDRIPECKMCRNDTTKVSVKVNAGVKKVEIEPDCCKACIWWDWFHNARRDMVGCKCDDGCDCGKLRYKKKETVVAKMEKLEIKRKK
jgi:hypothetical protein